MVPMSMQSAVWTAYRNAPKEGRARDRDYLAACAKAVEHVALAEGKPQQNSYRRILNRLGQIEAQPDLRLFEGGDMMLCWPDGPR
jgi:hypothetical protein